MGPLSRRARPVPGSVLDGEAKDDNEWGCRRGRQEASFTSVPSLRSLFRRLCFSTIASGRQELDQPSGTRLPSAGRQRQQHIDWDVPTRSRANCACIQRRLRTSSDRVGPRSAQLAPPDVDNLKQCPANRPYLGDRKPSSTGTQKEASLRPDRSEHKFRPARIYAQMHIIWPKPVSSYLRPPRA